VNAVPTFSPPLARVTRAWTALEAVEDPEIPAISIVDLGIVRAVTEREDSTLQVDLSPTYSGCPATEVIRQSVEAALTSAGERQFIVNTQLAPAWTTDWITAEGRRKLLAYGIVPPEGSPRSMRDLRRGDHPLSCPRCKSLDTEQLSEFGSTPCKALHRCRSCREPFEYFKCI
jgi:ring-1,2-phenylacetyl-CoA epoxidase subunit PaaD